MTRDRPTNTDILDLAYRRRQNNHPGHRREGEAVTDTTVDLMHTTYTARQPASLTITRGLPGSGKSTGSRGRGLTVNRDSIRRMLHADPHYYQRDTDTIARREKRVTAVQDATVMALLHAGAQVIVDDTNLRSSDITHWQSLLNRAIAEGVDAEPEIEIDDSYLTVPITECIRRQAGRPDDERVPAATIIAMAREAEVEAAIDVDDEALALAAEEIDAALLSPAERLRQSGDLSALPDDARTVNIDDRIGDGAPDGQPLVDLACAMREVHIRRMPDVELQLGRRLSVQSHGDVWEMVWVASSHGARLYDRSTWPVGDEDRAWWLMWDGHITIGSDGGVYINDGTATLVIGDRDAGPSGLTAYTGRLVGEMTRGLIIPSLGRDLVLNQAGLTEYGAYTLSGWLQRLEELA